MSSARACEEEDGGDGSDDPGDEDGGFPSPLFVDGIADGVGYLRIRELFYLFGKLRNVFLQRDKKMGGLHDLVLCASYPGPTLFQLCGL